MSPETSVLPSLPVISLAADASGLPAALADSFGRFGFAMVSDHGIDADLIAQAWDLTAQFFALPDIEKRQWHVPGKGGADPGASGEGAGHHHHHQQSAE